MASGLELNGMIHLAAGTMELSMVASISKRGEM